MSSEHTPQQPVDPSGKPTENNISSTPSQPASTKQTPATPSSLPNPPVKQQQVPLQHQQQQPLAPPQQQPLPPYPQPQQMYPSQHPHQQYSHKPKNYNLKGQFNPNYPNYQKYNNGAYDSYPHNKTNGNRMNNGNMIRHNPNNPNSSNTNNPNNNLNNNGYKKGYRNIPPQQFYPNQNPMMPMPYYPMAYPIQPQAVLPEKPITSPVKKHTQLSIKTKDGTPVNFTSHSKSSSISKTPSSTTSTSVPSAPAPHAANSPAATTASASASASTSATASASASAPASAGASKEPKEKTAESKKAFQLQFLQQLKAKKKASTTATPSSSATSTTTETASKESSPKEKEETKSTEPEPSAAPAASETKIEAPAAESEAQKPKQVEATTEKEASASVPAPITPAPTSSVPESVPAPVQPEADKASEITPTAESLPETKSEVKPEVQADSKPEEKAEEKVEEQPEEKAQKQPEDNAEEKPEEKAEETTEEKPEEKAVEKSEDNVEEKQDSVAEEAGPSHHMTMTEFFEKIEKAKVIPNVFKYKYAEGFHGPDPSLESRKVLTYDPIFLLQFEKIHYEVDDAWREKYLSKIYIPDRNESRDKSFRTRDNRTRSNGPLKGLPIRGEFEGRNNSRTGSKRKGRDARDSRDGRDKSRKGGDREGSRRSRGPRGEKSERADEKPQIKLAPEDVKPLEKTANRWVPKSQKQAKEVKYAPDGVTILYDDEDLEKKIRSLLNKLSLEQFDAITDELIELANQSKWEKDANALKTTVRLTFAKATDEPHWSSMYAKFCQKLVSTVDKSIYSEDYPIPNATSENQYYTGTNLAYRLLVTRCQSEYEKGWSTDLPVNEDGSPIEPELMSDEYYALAAQKRRGLGLVRFIGELYRLNLIKFRVIVGCIRILTTEPEKEDKPKTAKSNEPYLPQEDTLETLNQFMLTVGQPLEEDVPSCVEYAFQCIKSYIDNPAIGSRIKYKFLDLIDLRKARWMNADSKLAGPKTISQIHAEFNKKQVLHERERSSRSRSNRNNSKWGNDQISSTDISKVGMIRKSGESTMNVLRKGKSSASVANDFTTVSSRNKSSKGNAPPISRTGSTLSSATASAGTEEGSESRQQSNRFNLLMDNEEEENSAEEENYGEEESDEGEDEEAETDEAEDANHEETEKKEENAVVEKEADAENTEA